MKNLQILAFFAISLGSLMALAISVDNIPPNVSPTLNQSLFDAYTGGVSKTSDWR